MLLGKTYLLFDGVIRLYFNFRTRIFSEDEEHGYVSKIMAVTCGERSW
jgi:hypothetical protein